MIGLFIVGISDAMILIVPVCIKFIKILFLIVLSEKWFSVYERLIATSLGSYF